MWADEDEEESGPRRYTFEECKGDPVTVDPDSHWILDPLCQARTMVAHHLNKPEPPVCGVPVEHWTEHNPESPDYHPFVPPTEPLVWGENAWRHNVCSGQSRRDWINVGTTDEPEWEERGEDAECICECHWGTYYVNVYALDQGYGGPEEGGWYYECGEPVASVPFDTWKDAESERERLGKRFPTDTRYRYSVAPQGTDFGIYIERHFATSFPQRTPRYS